ncbi:MAG: dihydroorotase [Lachnobacterium sp.]|nr:dihydroorotase [Lachnobacterium sp.]MCI7531432.1 dihydroorotase [Lachnobacterium sp.]MDD7713564.1 dihydroorotase [Lachnobacterium sp.]MDY5461449.1 dihydroorotase [Agathobacter sp.]
MDILIKGGHVINPATKMDEVADVRIENDEIAEIGKNLKAKKTDRVIQAKGYYVMPGFIDMHVHFRDPGFEQKEDIYTGMAAAAHGGYTTVLTMPNTKPVVDNADVVNYVHTKAASGHCIHVMQVGAVTKGQQGKELADIKGMVEAGIPAISEDGKSVMNAEVYREGMLEAAKYGIPVLAHCEDINMVNGGVMNADAKAKELDMPGITNSVEDVIIARDIVLSKETGAQLHLCHCSTADSVKMVKLAKEEGLKVSAEVCPHHFTLTSDDIKKFVPQIENGILIPHETDADTNYKMNPPLRTGKDVEALKEGLRDGIMDVISTDHAPHTFDDKNTSMKKAPFGIVGLETAACLTYSELVLGGYLTPMQMAEKMSYNPARIIGIDKGDIQPGKKADVVLFDPNETYRIDKNTFASKGRNTPFDGREVTGRVKLTICDGNIVYEQ